MTPAPAGQAPIAARSLQKDGPGHDELARRLSPRRLGHSTSSYLPAPDFCGNATYNPTPTEALACLLHAVAHPLCPSCTGVFGYYGIQQALELISFTTPGAAALHGMPDSTVTPIATEKKAKFAQDLVAALMPDQAFVDASSSQVVDWDERAVIFVLNVTALVSLDFPGFSSAAASAKRRRRQRCRASGASCSPPARRTAAPVRSGRGFA